MEKEAKKQYNVNDFKININVDMKLVIKSPMAENVSYLIGFDGKQMKKTGTEMQKLRPFDGIVIHCNLVEPFITNHSIDIRSIKKQKYCISFF